MGKPTGKSLLKKLQVATEAGDFEAVRAISAEISQFITPPRQAKTPKSRAKKQASTRPAARPEAVADDQSSYIAQARPEKDTFIGSDGKEHKVGRKVKMDSVQFVNTFDPKVYADAASEPEMQFDRKQARKHRRIPRPGEPGAARDKAEKVKVVCELCRRELLVYPWECERLPGDDEAGYYCNKCIKKRGR